MRLILILYIVGLVLSRDTQYDYKPYRQLRGRGGGRSSGSGGRSGRSSGGIGRSGYYSGSISSKYGVRYTSVNTYLRGGRTYEPLYTYYLPVGYVSLVGYYSILHNKVYYDGYGYNFYYGAYAYYETSPNDTDYGEIMGMVLIIVCICCCMASQGYRSIMSPDEHDDMEIRSEVVTTTYTVDQNGNRI